jgi:hypothetical protein
VIPVTPTAGSRVESGRRRTSGAGRGNCLKDGGGRNERRRAKRRLLSRGAQETFGEEIVFRLDARQDEEISAAHRLDVFLELFAIEARLHGEKACGEVRLKADEQEPHVELAGVGDAAGIIVAPAEDPVASVSGVRGLARRMWAVRGTRPPFGSAA